MSPDTQPNVEQKSQSSTPADLRHEPATDDQGPALEKLSRLHHEAVETATLANLLGRTPYAAWLLIAGVGAMALGLHAVQLVPLLLWSLFVCAGAVAALRIYGRTVAVSFELLPLRAFAADLRAVLLYTGFAWGSGAFLALPAGGNPLTLTLFSVGAAAVLGVVLRSRAATLLLLAPMTGLAALSALLRPIPEGFAAAAMIVLFGAMVAGVAELAERWRARRLGRRLGVTPLPQLTFS